MKTRIVDTMIPNPRRGAPLIARFGRARLVARADGRAELWGASPDEETQAKEWISLFQHDTILHIPRPSATVSPEAFPGDARPFPC